MEKFTISYKRRAGNRDNDPVLEKEVLADSPNEAQVNLHEDLNGKCYIVSVKDADGKIIPDFHF